MLPSRRLLLARVAAAAPRVRVALALHLPRFHFG
jgi:hypothetical protein